MDDSTNAQPKPAAPSLHPVYTVTNIQNKVRVLDGTKVTYSSWVKLFQLHARGYKVLNHIDGTLPPATTDPSYEQWAEVDAIVLQWIYGSLSDELLVRVLEPESTALQAWVRIRNLFLNNKGSRAAALEHAFTNLTLKSMPSLQAYCQRLKELADQLSDVDSPVSASRLVIQLVRGLPSEYDTVAAQLNQSIPSWEEAVNMLELEEQRQANREKENPIAAAVTPDANPPLAAPEPQPQRRTQNPRGQPRYPNQRRQNAPPRYQNRNQYPNQFPQQKSSGQMRSGHNSNQPWTPYPWWVTPYGPQPAWNPPPCPYPTQPGWTVPWQQQSGGQQGTKNSTEGTHNRPAPQANITDFDPLEPTDIGEAFQVLAMEADEINWHMDTGASNHLSDHEGICSNSPNVTSIKSILVGNGHKMPIIGSGNTTFPYSQNTLHLNNVLYAPNVIKNLISVRQFTRDNFVSVEFDPFGFSVKDYKTGRMLSRHDSDSHLYPVTAPVQVSKPSVFTVSTPESWHDRLGHPGASVVDFLSSNKFIDCNKTSRMFCNSCHIAKHKRLPFALSNSTTILPFDIVHCDLWTSPIVSNTGYKYYMILIDDYTNFAWLFPLRFKSETVTKFLKFHTYIKTQFNLSIKSFQCDNGGEFDNTTFKNLAATHGIHFRFSCPHTSQQNGKAERMIRRINEIMLSLLTHASVPPTYWVEAAHTAVYLHNILPTKLLNNHTPTSALYLRHPAYDHLKVFGCLCYPNQTATRPHKLSHRSTPCVFLGYPPDHRGYRCLNLQTGQTIISRHVTFNESSFPFSTSQPTSDYSLLESDLSTIFTHPHNFPTSDPHPPTSPQHTSAHSPTPTSPTPTTGPSSSNHYTGPSLPPSPSQHSNHNSHPSSSDQNHPLNQTVQPQPTSSHPMTTRLKAGITKPKIHLNLHATTSPTVSPLPKSHIDAQSDPNWHMAMNDEYSALIENNTWELVPRPDGAHIIRCMWLFRHKFHANGTLQRYKARLVVNGKSQQVGVDCFDTFSPVVKPTTIRTVLSIAVSRTWPIHQLDVKNAFLHGDLNETVYMFQPPGYVDQTNPSYVCRLRKSLYGLKQAPRAWYHRFATFITKCGFHSTSCDTSLFVYRKDSRVAYLLLYVDDIITASDDSFLHEIIASLSKEFAMTDLGNLHHFLGIQVTRSQDGLRLSQEAYINDILARANMSSCKPCHTPCDTDSKLSANSGTPMSDPTLYRSLAGALQYLTFTRPDIAYAVQQVCLFMHDPREPHFNYLKRILRFLKGTSTHALHIKPSKSLKLTAYSDADWGGCPDSRRSTSGYCVFLGDNLVSWSSKRQQTVSRSSAEAEYRGVANATAETSWLRNLLLELHIPTREASIIFCDNVSAVYLSDNPVQHQRTKHVEIDIHFVRDKVRIGDIRVLHIPADYQYADIFTKGLSRQLFNRFKSSLCVR
uniref:Putative ribonuclease H-like domain-containing protein n=1 Tax=Helianthus annuus TaxID=4232 RepID=A0A251VD12_HELAN